MTGGEGERFMTSIQFLNAVNTQKSFESFIKPQFPADLPIPKFGLVRPEAQIPPQIHPCAGSDTDALCKKPGHKQSPGKGAIWAAEAREGRASPFEVIS